MHMHVAPRQEDHVDIRQSAKATQANPKTFKHANIQRQPRPTRFQPQPKDHRPIERRYQKRAKPRSSDRQVLSAPPTESKRYCPRRLCATPAA
ncbi:hypothetical protein PTTG_26874 [Puccinia triticina 1-1 BBBD Race 1]|uniref:Uncharacterized protein n=1 Tax=Puccinia triticina (isolate 1-1 / race 1 (BBBD)) TaxID=630390 RepID=A0A180GQH1_PUCT1|nr:hypothetical protein PTTG_26874 [Puccinia triticina 1-1 BBBD Race 1]